MNKKTLSEFLPLDSILLYYLLRYVLEKTKLIKLCIIFEKKKKSIPILRIRMRLGVDRKATANRNRKPHPTASFSRCL